MFVQLTAVFLAVTSIAASTVPVARQVGGAATCTLVLTPQSPVTSTTNLVAEFNLRTYIYNNKNTCRLRSFFSFE